MHAAKMLIKHEANEAKCFISNKAACECFIYRKAHCYNALTILYVHLYLNPDDTPNLAILVCSSKIAKFNYLHIP